MSYYASQYTLSSYRHDAPALPSSVHSPCALRAPPTQDFHRLARPNNMNSLPSLSELGLLDLHAPRAPTNFEFPKTAPFNFPLVPATFHRNSSFKPARTKSNKVSNSYRDRIARRTSAQIRQAERGQSPQAFDTYGLATTLQQIDLSAHSLHGCCSPASSATDLDSNFSDFSPAPSEKTLFDSEDPVHAPGARILPKQTRAPVKKVAGKRASHPAAVKKAPATRKRAAPAKKAPTPPRVVVPPPQVPAPQPHAHAISPAPVADPNKWMRYVDQTNRVDKNGARLFRCLFNNCGHTQTKQAVKRHVNDVHLDIRPWICSYCCRAFKQRMSMQIHIYSKHTFETPFKCEHCKMKYSDPARRNKHSRLIHPEMPIKTRPKVAYPEDRNDADDDGYDSTASDLEEYDSDLDDY